MAFQVLDSTGKIKTSIAAAAVDAADITSGILPDARMPNLTGDVTTVEGAVGTTLANIPAISGANLTTLNAGNVSTGVLATARGGTSVDIASAALPLGSGQITFPATANPSAGANVLDDYEEGVWTPALTFDTPGNLSVAYNILQGSYTKIGNIVRADFFYNTATFTHTTAAGAARLTGLPFAACATYYNFGALQPNMNFGAAITDFFCRIDPSNSYISFLGYTPGVGPGFLGVTHMLTGVTQSLLGSIVYRV